MDRQRLEVLSFKLPASLSRKLTRSAAARGISRSALLREAAERAVAGDDADRRCFGAMAADVAGCFEGSGDLSTNPRHLEDFAR